MNIPLNDTGTAANLRCDEATRLSSILDTTTDFVGTADPEGNLLYLNRAGRRMLGLAEDASLVGRVVSDNHPKWAIDMIGDEGIRTAIRQGTWRGDSAILGADGRDIPVSQVIIAHRNALGGLEFVSTIARDETERQQAAAALRCREHEFHLLFAANPQPLAVYDPQTLELIEVNNVFTELHGYSRDELLRMKLPDLLDAEEIPRALHYIADRDGANSDAGVWRQRTSDGRQLWVHVRGHAVEFAGRAARLVITEDVTKYRQAAEALRRSQEQFHLLFAANPGAMWVYDPETFGILEVNDAALEQYGYSREEFLQLKVTDLRPLAEVPALLEFLRTRSQDGVDVLEAHHWRKDGSKVDVRVRSHAIDFNGRPARLVLAEDITARRAAEAQREAAEHALAVSVTELQKANAVKDELLGLVSHELRTPLTTISGNAKALLRHGERIDPETRQTALQDIDRDAGRLQRLIENMLMLAHIDCAGDVELEPVLLQRLLSRLVEELQHRGLDAPLTLDVAEDLPLVAAQPGYVEQVVENLISNAIKYSDLSGTVAVRAVKHDDVVAVLVEDRGRGITVEEAEQIFTPFYRSPRTAASAKGVGLGLAVCRRLVEAQGGTIWAAPRDGGGTTFGFTLPRLDR